MKKIIHGLLAAALSLSATAQATVNSNKTFLLPRTALSDNAVADTAGMSKGKKCGIGANVSLLGYYRASHNESELAKYFGGGTLSEGDVTGHIDVNKGGTVSEHLAGDQISTYGAAQTDVMYGRAELKPQRIAYGAQLSWKQCLNAVVDGLSFSVSAPLEHVRTNMNFKAVESTAQAVTDNTGAVGKTITDYFTGADLGKTVAAAKQGNLTLSKMSVDGKDVTVTELADINVRVGYAFLKDADYNVALSISSVIPTGNKATGAYAFEPIAGRNGAFAFGAGLNADVNLWRSKDKKSSFDFCLAADYQYVFESTQKRTWGVYDHVSDKQVELGHYRIAVTHGATQGESAVKYLNQDAKVEGGGQFNGVAGFAGSYNGFSFGLAYNLFAAQEETVKAATTWKSNNTGFVVGNNPMNVAAVVGDNGVTYGGPIMPEGTTTGGLASDGDPLGNQNALRYYIYSKAAATPSQLTHKVAGNLGYCFDMATPINVSLVGEYEFDGNDNSSVASWMIGGKVGICF